MKNINIVTQTKQKNIELIITVGNEAAAPLLIPSAVVPMPQSSAKYLKNNSKTYVTILIRSLWDHSDVNFAEVEYHKTALPYQPNDNKDNKETEYKDLTCFP